MQTTKLSLPIALFLGLGLIQAQDNSPQNRTFSGSYLKTGSAWNSGTAQDATQAIFTNSTAAGAIVQLVQTSTISAGAASFEITYDGTNWVTVAASQSLDPASVVLAPISLPYTLQASTNKPFLIVTHGARSLRVKLTTQITGSGTVTPYSTVLNFAPMVENKIQGAIAHDDVGTSLNPVMGGILAVAHGSNPSAVAANDLSRWLGNRHGIPWVIGGHPNVVSTQYYWTTAQTNDAVVSVSSGTKIVVTKLGVTCDKANTVDVAVRVGFGTSTLTTAPTDGNTAASTLLVHGGVAAGSGYMDGTGAGILGVGADDEDLRITTEAATSGSCSMIVSYYTVES